MPERQLRFLLALETFTRRDDCWREVGTALLASTAGLSVNTTARARGELVKSDAIGYRRGNGRGQVGTYRIKVPINDVHLPEPGKVPSDTDHLSSPGKVPNNAGHLSEPGKVPKQPRKGTQPGSEKVPKRNAATSGNAIGALEPIALEPSALSRAGRDLGAALAGVGATDDEIDFTIDGIKNSSRVEDPAAYMLGTVAKPGGAARLLDRTRRRLAAQDAAPRSCDRDGPGRYSGACRGGDGQLCVWSWCECACHGRRA